MLDGILVAIGSIFGVFGAGRMARQETQRSLETINSRDQAKQLGKEYYIDGYGCTRLTKNGHMVILSTDNEGYRCWYDIEANEIGDRFEYNAIMEKVNTKEEKEKRYKLVHPPKTETDELLEKIIKSSQEAKEWKEKHNIKGRW